MIYSDVSTKLAPVRANGAEVISLARVFFEIHSNASHI